MMGGLDASRTAGQSWRPLMLIMLVTAALALLAMVRALDRDDSQYVAAIALMRHGLPYRDFVYLQTPLQPLLLAPLAWIDPSLLLFAARAVNALLAGAVLALVFRTLRERGLAMRPAIAVAALLLATETFLYCATRARNDMLPLLLEAVAIWALLRACDARGRRAMAFVAGLGMALAASAKLSYALPFAATGLIVLIDRLRAEPRLDMLAAGAGALVGSLPALVFAGLFPAEFRFAVLDYHRIAPEQWNLLNGDAIRLNPLFKLGKALTLLAQGATLVVLLVVAWRWLRHRADWADRRQLYLDLLILAGCIAAFAPNPTLKPYMALIMLPLFLRFGLLLGGGEVARGWRWLLLPSVIAGLGCTAIELVDGARGAGVGTPVTAARDAAALRVFLDRAAPGAMVSSLRPDVVAGAGHPLDPRFATGPFLFRTRALFPNVIALDTVDRLGADPPAVIVTGHERRRAAITPHGFDALLDDWARRHGYRAHRTGRLLVWLRP